MPRVKQKASLSLKQLCLRSITDNIDSYWYKDFLSQGYYLDNLLYILGPLDEIPPDLIHEVWLCMKRRKLLKKHHSYLLISPFFSTLDLSDRY